MPPRGRCRRHYLKRLLNRPPSLPRGLPPRPPAAAAARSRPLPRPRVRFINPLTAFLIPIGVSCFLQCPHPVLEEEIPFLGFNYPLLYAARRSYSQYCILKHESAPAARHITGRTMSHVLPLHPPPTCASLAPSTHMREPCTLHPHAQALHPPPTCTSLATNTCNLQLAAASLCRLLPAAWCLLSR